VRQTDLSVMVVRVGVAISFLGQMIGIDGTNTFQLQIFSSMNIVGTTVLGGLWAWQAILRR